MRRLALIIALALPLSAQDSLVFPRFSITGGTAPSNFETNARIDPDEGDLEGTLVNFERDLGLEDARTLRRFGVQWRPFARHELAGTFFSAPREGFEQINRDIVFRDEVYPVSATVTSQFDLDYWSASYTYWARRGARDGFGISLGLANLAMNASVTAETDDATATVTQRAETDVPVALIGVQSRIALAERLHLEGSIATLPRVTIEDYTGRALTGFARIEYRPLNWLGIGAAYNYFKLDVDVAQAELRGSLDMTIRGPEGYLRLAF